MGGADLVPCEQPYQTAILIAILPGTWEVFADSANDSGRTWG